MDGGHFVEARYSKVDTIDVLFCLYVTQCIYSIRLSPPLLHDKTEVLKHASFVLQTLDLKTRPYFVSSYYGFYEMRLAVGDV